MRKFFANIKGDKKLMALYWLILVFILELTVFNFRFYQGLGYDKIRLDDFFGDSSVEQVGENEFRFNSNGAKMTFNNIDAHVKNLYIDINCTGTLPDKPSFDEKKAFEENKRVKLKITIDDASNSKGITMPEKYVVSTVERTKYIPLNLSGISHTLTLEFNNVENKSYYINSIVLNKGVPFGINFIRIIVLFLIGILLYIIRPFSEFYNYRLNTDSKKQRGLIGGVIAAQIILMLAGSLINPFYVYNTIGHQNQYNELAEALLDGHFYLNDVPDTKLAELENPYDPEERDRAGVYGSWDHAYYNEKYYVYFGIVPALIFNIPSKALFHKDIRPYACIAILIPIFIIMSYALIYALTKKFGENEEESIPLLLYIMLTTLFVNGSGAAFFMVWPDMYTLPIVTALTLAVSGLYFWLSAFKPYENGYKLSSLRLLIGSLLLALIAGSRPQLLTAIFFAIPIFFNAVFKDRKLFSKSSIKQSLCFALPIVLFALFMFWYNFARFGSIFDFGANYNLTTNDMTSRGFMPGRLAQGIFSYILQPIAFEGKFPYLIGPSGASGFMGSNYSEGSYGGIIFQAPIIFILLILPKVKDELKKKGFFAVTLMLIIFSFLIAGVDSAMGGILSRYALDMDWMLILAAIIVILGAYNKYKDSAYWKLFGYCMPVCFVMSMLITFGLVIGVRVYTPFDSNPETYWKIASAIQFWL